MSRDLRQGSKDGDMRLGGGEGFQSARSDREFGSAAPSSKIIMTHRGSSLRCGVGVCADQILEYGAIWVERGAVLVMVTTTIMANWKRGAPSKLKTIDWIIQVLSNQLSSTSKGHLFFGETGVMKPKCSQKA
jgi:hypothetical protein